ncbi:ferredoxin-fold anticodon-binding domain-containing protein 1 homolog [Haliotis rufescens]|uniref:ferredoxin-fold anticodon-binding domain-containing protein 1 homolog n=1 Tax=Haliotis rufescens TaxID=6454 RepID=UPI00201E803A|nr:ferredoxin-fold anticodon-binding domain-containing protein 1 homolog [Haliotis rufescens]
MEAPLEGRLLLVGEGDFSLAVALVSKCGFHGDQVLATSLETEESIEKHHLASRNIQILRDRGVRVCFDVDATELQTCAALQVMEDARFTRIIFNFPHAGGKSNHKKNRTLLNNFFSSAVKVLTPGGQVMVTLCRGQGGTPADQPMRAWHDSWQVVSMAANASLILTQVVPFSAEEFQEYNSVGFRSLDKGFHTEGALTHVFEVAESVAVPDGVQDTGELVWGERTYTCPRYLEHKLNRTLLYSLHHPLHQLRAVLEELMSAELGSQAHHLDTPSVVKEGSGPRLVNQGDAQTHAAVYDFFPPPYSLRESFQCPSDSAKEDGIVEEKEQDESERFTNDLTPVGDNLSGQFHLRSGVIEELPPIVSLMATSGVACHMVSCDMYGQRVIGQKTSCVGHQMMVVSRDGNPDEQVWAISRVVQKATGLYSDITSVDDENIAVSTDFGELRVSHEIQVVSDQKNTGDVCGCVLNWTCPDDKMKLILVVLDLNKIVMKVHEIPVLSLLWSTDPRFKNQFADNTGTMVKYKPFSLYSMKFFHDLSFWENPTRQFEEQTLHDIVREVARDVVTDVRMIDSYRDSETDRQSRCYRMTFQSHDQALSYITSWKLQSMLRLEVANKMGIILR